MRAFSQINKCQQKKKKKKRGGGVGAPLLGLAKSINYRSDGVILSGNKRLYNVIRCG